MCAFKWIELDIIIVTYETGSWCAHILFDGTILCTLEFHKEIEKGQNLWLHVRRGTQSFAPHNRDLHLLEVHYIDTTYLKGKCYVL